MFVALATSAPASAAAPDCSIDAAGPDAVLCEVNAARADAGRKPLRRQPQLDVAASAHTSDMVTRRYFAHEDPEGHGPIWRARRAGYMRGARSWTIGEVLAWARGTPLTAAAAVRSWLGSPSHRRLILARRYTRAGIGVLATAPVGDPATAPAGTMVMVLGRRATR